MSDTKMLQVLIDGQLELKNGHYGLRNDLENGLAAVNQRLDTIGMDVARLLDDTPTIQEHDGLVKRVDKLEKQPALV